MLNKDEYNLLYNCATVPKALEDIFGDQAFLNEPIKLMNNYNNFLITIELSTLCNLNCKYCYQDKIKKREEISWTIIDSILKYIENVFNKDDKITNIIIGFIGGEPLLHKKKILFIMDSIIKLCELYSKKYSFHIDTNGTILVSDIYNNYDNVKLSVTLSLKEDHNRLRCTNDFDCFDKIVCNLSKLKNEKNKLSIRYNTNNLNIVQFEKFVEYVKHNIPNVYNIDPMYTDNYEKNNMFNNKLLIDQFSKWNSSLAIDILIKNDYPITGNIPSVLQLCAAYQPYSCKVFSTGYVVLCDSMEYNEKLNIEDLSNDIGLLNFIYYKYKNYNPLYDNECSNCNKLVQCQGKIFCKKDFCSYQKRYNDEMFIKTYVKYFLANKEKYFINM